MVSAYEVLYEGRDVHGVIEELMGRAKDTTNYADDEGPGERGAAEYAAAFRHIVTVFRQRGVTNVAFVWTMMGWTFEPRSAFGTATQAM